jgi:GrpB-like predicted nucleotidyltransferase (UPF0157 family)
MLIIPYQNSWKNDFKIIEFELLKALNGIEIIVNHVGSTSVPNLAAKPIIDIDIVYPELVKFDDIEKKLSDVGYEHVGDFGIKDREVFQRNGKPGMNKILDSIHHHLYVCPVYSEELRRHLLFRNYLRVNELVRSQYEKIKIRIAAKAKQDKKIYAQIKETEAQEFIESVLLIAEKEFRGSKLL